MDTFIVWMWYVNTALSHVLYAVVCCFVSLALSPRCRLAYLCMRRPHFLMVCAFVRMLVMLASLPAHHNPTMVLVTPPLLPVACCSAPIVIARAVSIGRRLSQSMVLPQGSTLFRKYACQIIARATHCVLAVGVHIYILRKIRKQSAKRTGAATRESLRRDRAGGFTSPAFHACGSGSPLSARYLYK